MTDSRSVLITTGSEPVIEWQVGLMFCEVRKSTVHAVLTTLHAHEQTLFERFLRGYASLFDPKHQLPNRFNIVLHRQVLDCLRNWTNERMRDAFERLLADVRLPIGYAPYGLLEDPVEVADVINRVIAKQKTDARSTQGRTVLKGAILTGPESRPELFHSKTTALTQTFHGEHDLSFPERLDELAQPWKEERDKQVKKPSRSLSVIMADLPDYLRFPDNFADLAAPPFDDEEQQESAPGETSTEWKDRSSQRSKPRSVPVLNTDGQLRARSGLRKGANSAQKMSISELESKIPSKPPPGRPAPSPMPPAKPVPGPKYAEQEQEPDSEQQQQKAESEADLKPIRIPQWKRGSPYNRRSTPTSARKKDVGRQQNPRANTPLGKDRISTDGAGLDLTTAIENLRNAVSQVSQIASRDAVHDWVQDLKTSRRSR